MNAKIMFNKIQHEFEYIHLALATIPVHMSSFIRYYYFFTKLLF